MTFKRYGDRKVQNQKGDEGQHPGLKGVEGDEWSYPGRALYGLPAETGRGRNHSLPLTCSKGLLEEVAGRSGTFQAKCNLGECLGYGSK